MRGFIEKPPGSGKYCLRIRLEGRTRYFKVRNKTEARLLQGRLKAEQLQGRYFERPKVVPFRDMAKEYIDRVDTRRRRKGDDKARIDCWVRAFGDQDSKTITVRQIERELTQLANQKKAPGTIARYLVVLKAIFNNGSRLGILKENPASRVQAPKVNNVLIRYLTDEQEFKLMENLPEKYRSIVKIAINTGCRQGELLRLRWADLDWNVGVMTIHETKIGESRKIPMNSIVQGVLTDLKKRTKPGHEDCVFPLDRRYLRRVFERAVLNSGLTPFRFHDLRHTFASRLAMAGQNDRTLMALGGWKSPRMLDRYAHLAPAHLWAAVEGLVQAGEAQTKNQCVPKSVPSEVESEENWSGKGDLNPRPSPWQGSRSLENIALILVGTL
jgi:integrase